MNNLVLENIKTDSNSLKEFIFSNYLKKDFLNCQLKFKFEGSLLISVNFYSNKYGVANYFLETEQISVSSWEKEEDVKSISGLSKHYTSITINSGENLDYFKQKLLIDIIENSTKEIKEVIEQVFENKYLYENDFKTILKLI